MSENVPSNINEAGKAANIPGGAASSNISDNRCTVPKDGTKEQDVPSSKPGQQAPVETGKKDQSAQPDVKLSSVPNRNTGAGPNEEQQPLKLSGPGMTAAIPPRQKKSSRRKVLPDPWGRMPRRNVDHLPPSPAPTAQKTPDQPPPPRNPPPPNQTTGPAVSEEPLKPGKPGMTAAVPLKQEESSKPKKP